VYHKHKINFGIAPLGKTRAKKKVLKKYLLRKKISLSFILLLMGLTSLPPMDLSHAHMQIKYKYTGASCPIVHCIAASPPTTPPVALLRCP
jgi:hypothetical protein